MSELNPEEEEARAKWRRLLDRREAAAERRDRWLEQTQRRVDLRLGYLVYCIRRFSGRSQGDLAQRIGATQSSVSKWERGERLPSLSTLSMAADSVGLELVVGLRDPHANDVASEFLLLTTYRGEGQMVELDIFFDSYAGDYVPARPWRARLEAMNSKP